MKKFIITMDTEGDNLWNWHEGDEITTHNTHYLLRFQQLCEKYGFKPVWLTNYEMIMDPDYVEFIKNVEKNHTGELGITVYDKEHIHIQYRFDQEIRNVLEYCSSVPQAETEGNAV